MRSVLVWLAALLAGCAAERPLQRSEFTRLCMGVQTRIILYAPSEQAAFSAASAAFDRINQLDALMSDYQRRSELNRLSDSAGGEPVAISDDLFDVLSISNTIATQTGGAFDPTIGPAVQLWRGARRSGSLPSESELLLARGLVNYRNLVLDPVARTARLTVPGMRLDLGGIGKGYAAQQAVELLTSRGTSRCLVALAGDIVVGEPPPGASGWAIVVSGEQDQSVARGAAGPTLSFARGAISTSGDTAQFIEIDGRRYSHICDPRTGLGIEARRSVTILAPRGEISDALATAACILGPVSVEPVLAQHPRVAAIFQTGHSETSIYDPDHLITWVMLPQ
jgi:thiamine biosynthesis lipoprotein